MTSSGGSSDYARWRVFLSHTSELQDYPPRNSYVAAAKYAISAAGHVIVDMADFPAADQSAAQMAIGQVQACDVYVGVLGTRYGSPVRDKPEVSYTELEFDAATEAGLDRLMFLLDEEAADVGIPPRALIDREFGARQDVFRHRVRESLVTMSFASPGELGQLVERSLRELAEVERRRRYAIFISYRRQGSDYFTGRLSDRLVDSFGADRVFVDVDTIGPGVDFAQAIRGAVKTSAVLLAIISPQWLAATDEQGHRRLEDPDDLVRLEIEAALADNIRIIPILVDGAAMPPKRDLPDSLAGLVRFNAFAIRYESFRNDAEHLVTQLRSIIPDR